MAEPLKLVRTLDQVRDDVVRDLRTNWKSISDLERKHGLNRIILVDLQKKFDPTKKNRNIVKIPRVPKASEFSPLLTTTPVPPSRFSQHINVWALRLFCYALAGVGIALNCQYSYSLGRTLPESILLGAWGASIDGLTVYLPSQGAALWAQKRHVASVLAWSFVFVCAFISVQSAISFGSANLGDTRQGQENVVQYRKDLNAEVAGVRAELAKIVENRDPQEIEQAIKNAEGQPRWISSKSCTVITTSAAFCDDLFQLRASKRAAERRIELDGRLRELTGKIYSLAPISEGDRITAGHIDIERLGMWIRAGMLVAAGIVLMLA